MFVAESSLFEESAVLPGSRQEGCQQMCVLLGTSEARQCGVDGSPCGKQQEEFL
jgi:hypothetical protein